MHVLSYSQFGELLGIDPAHICQVVANPITRTVMVEELDMSQTSGSFPALTRGTKKGGSAKPDKLTKGDKYDKPGKPGKRGC